jgi:hypothetical protein
MNKLTLLKTKINFKNLNVTNVIIELILLK